MTFPAAIASAQREAVTNDLREVRASLGATLAALRAGDVRPHLIGLDHVGFGLLLTHLNDAEAAIAAAIEAITDEAVHA